SILVGPNNTGKSTMLEAIAVAALAPDARTLGGILLRRGGPALDALSRVVGRGAGHAMVSIGSIADGEPPERRATVATGDAEPPWASEARKQGLQDPMQMLSVALRTGTTRVVMDARGRFSENFGPSRSQVAVKLVDVEAVRSGAALEDAY